MSLTIQTHPDRFEVVPYLDPPDPFVVVRAYQDGASVSLFLRGADLCDALIAAAAEAKRQLEPPVITDSERTCDQANPESGAHCRRGGDHGVHRDTDGEEWRTDEPEKCSCGHPKGSHMSGRPRPCAMTGCGCGKFRDAAQLDERAAGHPVGSCGHPVTPGAWSQGYGVCRECLSDRTPAALALYDRATAGEQLPQATS